MKTRIAMFGMAVFLLSGCGTIKEALNVESEEVSFARVPTQRWERSVDTFFESYMTIRYDLKRKTYKFLMRESLGYTGFIADETFMPTLRSSIKKYFEWREKAISDSVTLTKNIISFESPIGYWSIGDNWYTSGPYVISLEFASQTTEKHALVMKQSEMGDLFNSYLTHKPDMIYFDYAAATVLDSVLSIEYFNKWEQDYQKQKEINASFK